MAKTLKEYQKEKEFDEVIFSRAILHDLKKMSPHIKRLLDYFKIIELKASTAQDEARLLVEIMDKAFVREGKRRRNDDKE